MASNRTMSTQQIKRGLENIKRAQLQVLKQLRGDSFITETNPTNPQSMSNIKYNQGFQISSNNNNNTYKRTTQQIFENRENIQANENRQNIQGNGTRANKSQMTTTNNERKFQNKQYELSHSNQRSQQSNENSNQFNQKSVRTIQSMTQASVSGQSYEALRKQFSSQRQQLKRKLSQISQKLNQLEKQSQGKSISRVQQVELNKQVKKLKQQKKGLEESVNSLRQQIEQLMKNQKKLKSELQLRQKQNTILQTQMKSLKSQTVKQARAIKQLQAQISKHTNTIKELKQEALRGQLSRINMDVVMREVKSISLSHDFMFNKLKESTTIDMNIVEKQSDIQNSLSRLLDYFQNLSSSGSRGYFQLYHNNQEQNNNYLNGAILNNRVGFVGNNHNDNKKFSVNQSRQLIKRSIISQSRAQQQDELEQLVRQIGGNLSTKQLIQQNQSLKKKLHQLNKQKASGYGVYKNDSNERLYEKSGKYTSQSNQKYNSQSNGKYQLESKRLIHMQLQDMREQVAKFKKFKLQIKQDQQQLQKQTLKFKLKAKDLQAKLQTTQRKLTQTNNGKFQLQKKTQQQSIEIISLNSIIKELNSKLYNNETDSPLSQLRTQFNKLLQTNSLIQRQNHSLKAMNQALQAQIQTLKYEKDQFETNNKQKHELIQRQIQQRNHLLEQVNKATHKHKLLQQEIDKLNTTLQLNQEQTLKSRKHYQDLLQQKNQQTLTLRKQIEQLYKQSREYHQVRFSFDKLLKEHKQLARKSLKMGETLTHLWSVKQAEYHNINKILGLLKNDQPHDQQNSAHF